LVAGALKDADTRLLFKHIDAPDEEEGGAKVDRPSDSDVPDDIEPATSPARDAAPVGGGQHKGLVVDTCSRDEPINYVTLYEGQ